MKENTAWLQVLRVIPAGGSAEETIDFPLCAGEQCQENISYRRSLP